MTAALGARLDELAQFGAYEAGIDRALFTPPDFAARTRFAQWAGEAGFMPAQDRVGNIFARRAGRRDLPAILIGSHLDTVRTGGMYDGAYGVIGALCALERLAAQGIVTDHPLEAVAWAGEEGSRFPLGCLGSGAFAELNPAAEIDALVDADGTTFAQARDGAAGLLPGIERRTSFPRPAAYLELHIEQGPVLERAGARLGVVTAIAGQARFEVELRGESGHAGTVPMTQRSDALCAAAELVLALEARARELGDAVVTVGRLVVEPNQTNVIPATVRLRVDARSVDDDRIEALAAAVREGSARIASHRGVEVSVTELERRRAVPMDARLRAAVGAVIAAIGAPSLELPSGAGHDAMCIGRVAPAAMLFVPSAGGRSHVGGEYTTPEDLELGVEALVNTIVAVDRIVS